MRILQVVPTYLPAVRHGGPVRAVHGLARALVARGHQVTVFTTRLHGDGLLDVPTDREVDLDGVAVRYFEVGWPRRLARAPTMARALAAGVSAFDLVHVHSLFLWPTAVAARAAARRGVPYLVSPRGMLVADLFRRRGRWRKRAWLAVAERRTLERARRLVVTSELEAREAAGFGLRLPPIAVVPNGVDIPGEAPRATLPPDWQEFLARGVPFLYLGRLSWKKGLETLIGALAEAPEARVLLAGNDEEGVLERLLALARRIGVRDRLLAVGFVDGEVKRALLAGARALVLPSLSENFGNVVLEAWAEGTPVLVTPGVGLAEAVREAGAGRVVEGSPDALAAALRELAADPAAARAMGERGRRLARERFTWAAIAGRAEALYREVLEEGRGARG